MPLIELLDIGGEGRYLDAWNLNPNETKTLGSRKGTAIPRRIDGRAEVIPLPDRCVGSIIMERTPLRRCAIAELLRVIQRGGTIVLRHHVSDHHDPHGWAHRLIPVGADIRRMKLGNQELQESKYDLGHMPKGFIQRE